ncbi:PREDICTED: serglycin [Thamnophis sirtalis]|uniref:Serglycin n=1 Tax=Thamnophis sirtalis TaxID=35019 RepID=A0A6I9YKX7_9SAUR|nr:PREDICTED: serglycin [Thamnophis sirtalis]
MPVKPMGRIFVALGVILLLGCPGQGAPQKGRYMWVRCKPDANSANCIEEKGPSFVMTDESATIPFEANPTREILQDQLISLPFSGDEEGSGNEEDPETGSGFENDLEEPEVSEKQPNMDLKLKLSNEGLFPHETIL